MLTRVRDLCSAQSAEHGGRLQTLWSGYGEIVRVHLVGGPAPSVIVKHVRPPRQVSHPRGWSSDRSHERKLRSYEVEMCWYELYATRCGEEARIPRAFATEATDDGFLFVLEDLDAAGFPARRASLALAEIEACIRWLAHFHAAFVYPRSAAAEATAGLWPIGTYWHLATRPDEYDAMERGPLRDAAATIDAALNAASYLTLVHGDAKVANFCFSPDGSRVAALDFQYVGGGCGIKDVVYLLSCLSSAHCERHADAHLNLYFDTLRASITARPALANIDTALLEEEWRALVPHAWADFERFLAGWAPDHAKRDRYAAAMTRRALAALA